MKKKIWPGSTQLGPLPVVLVGTGGHGFRNNLLTVGWIGIVSSEPAMLSIAIRPSRFSYETLRVTGEFSVNIPSPELAETVDWCGVVSGKDVDKFKARNLHAFSGSQIASPLVEECPVNLECRVANVLELGSHHLFLADILAVQISENMLDDFGAFDPGRNGGLLGYVHGHYYAMGEALGHFGYSIRRKPGGKVRSSAAASSEK